MTHKLWSKQQFLVSVLTVLAVVPGTAGAKKSENPENAAVTTKAATLRPGRNVTSCNVFYGPGGEQHQPHGPFKFIREDLNGTSPKFVVRDSQGVKWKIKLGAEARPETAASRLIWAAGYFANEDYFLPVIQVTNLPARLHRGRRFVASDGSVRAVRLKRYLVGEKKIGNWEWRENPFTGTRELNGLRVLMALINNWDLTGENNAIFRETSENPPSARQIYMVSDLGSSFGTPGLTWPMRKARGNVLTYSRSAFISRVTADYVDFRAPRRDSLVFLATPREFMQKLRLSWIGKHIPRQDARWMGQVLAQLSPEQIRDAFRAAGYSSGQVERFAAEVQGRIAELNQL